MKTTNLHRRQAATPQRSVQRLADVRRNRSGGGAAEPTPGWKGRGMGTAVPFVNTRVPSVPSTLDLRLNEYYAGAVIMGLIAGQATEPNKKWAKQWSFDMGELMQAEALKRRRRKAR